MPMMDTRPIGIADMSANEVERRMLEAQQAERRRRIVEASDILRARDFQAAGMRVPPIGSLEASPMLLRALEAKKQERAA